MGDRVLVFDRSSILNFCMPVSFKYSHSIVRLSHLCILKQRIYSSFLNVSNSLILDTSKNSLIFNNSIFFNERRGLISKFPV